MQIWRTTTQTLLYHINTIRENNHQTNQENGYIICWRLSTTGLVYEDMNAKTGVLL